MRWICFLLISIFISGGLAAQDKQAVKSAKKEAAQRKKVEKAMQAERQYKAMDSLLKGKKFVLEARFLKTRDGNRSTVSSILNFISVDSLSATIQVGTMQRAGYNGVGGYTVQGKIQSWKLETDPGHKNFYLMMTVQGNRNTYDVSMNIDGSGYADATLTALNSGRLTFEGNVVSKEETVIYKGQTR